MYPPKSSEFTFDIAHCSKKIREQALAVLNLICDGDLGTMKENFGDSPIVHCVIRDAVVLIRKMITEGTTNFSKMKNYPTDASNSEATGVIFEGSVNVTFPEKCTWEEIQSSFMKRRLEPVSNYVDISKHITVLHRILKFCGIRLNWHRLDPYTGLDGKRTIQINLGIILPTENSLSLEKN